MAEERGRESKREVLGAVAIGAALLALLLWIELGPVDDLDGLPLGIAHDYLIWALEAGVSVCLVLFLLYRARTKRLSRDLAHKELHFRTAFQTSPDAVNINRLSDGLYVDINEGFTSLTGYTREDAIGVSSLELNIWADPADRERLVAGLKADGVVRNLEARFRRKDGSTATGLMSARVLMIGSVPHILSVTRDISEIKAAREAEEKSRARFKRIFDHIQDVYYEATMDGTILQVSPSVKSMLGYEVEEVVSRRIAEFYDDPTQRERFIAELTRTGESRDFIVVMRHKSGALKHLSANAVFISEADEGPGKYCGSLRDVEEQHRARVMLQESERKYRELVEQANSIIVRLSPEGRILFVNDFAARFLGYTWAELIGRDATGNIFIPDQEAPRFPLSLAQPGGDSLIRTAEARDRKGNPHFVSWSAKVERDSSGRPISILCVGNDVTAHVLAERRVALLEGQIAKSQKLEALGTLASGIAHDFNNLLAAIIGYSELVSLKLPEDSEEAEHLKSVLDAADRASRLVRQILTFARASKQEKAVVSLNSVLEEALNFLRASIPTTVQIVSSVDCPGSIEADPTRLHQVAMNLCTNAARAMPDGGVLTVTLSRVTLEVSPRDLALSSPADYFLLTVADEGVGMDPEIIDRIFDPFFTTRQGEGGTGMGLAVVHGIVTDLGGAIRVSSAPGRGSTFEVFLPASGLAGAKARAPERRDAGGNESILLVDDEKSVLDAMRKTLQSMGYRVVTATSSPAALELFTNDPAGFDLIVSDVTMPVMTGDLLLEKVREIAPGLPAILVSGYSSHLDEERLEELRVSGFLTKPVNRATLAAEVRRALDATGADAA